MVKGKHKLFALSQPDDWQKGAGPVSNTWSAENEVSAVQWWLTAGTSSSTYAAVPLWRCNYSHIHVSVFTQFHLLPQLTVRNEFSNGKEETAAEEEVALVWVCVCSCRAVCASGSRRYQLTLQTSWHAVKTRRCRVIGCESSEAELTAAAVLHDGGTFRASVKSGCSLTLRRLTLGGASPELTHFFGQ